MKGRSGIGVAPARSVLVERISLDNSLLYRTRLYRYIWYSLVIHLVVLVFYWLVPIEPSDPVLPPPIKVTFAKPEKPRTELEKGTIIDAPKPKKIEKPRSSKLLASNDSHAHSNLAKSRDKIYRQKKTVVPKPSGIPQVAKESFLPLQKKASKQNSIKNKHSFALSDRGTLVPQAKEKQQIKNQSNLRFGTKGTLSMLDGFDPEKYASLDTKSLDESYDDEDVSLDTTETQYASYFARIKHQIERVWKYPMEAQKRGISGRPAIRFRISKDGNLLSVNVVGKSDYEILDFAAVKAVKDAAPFYPFPVEIKKETLPIVATFLYKPNYRSLRK